MAQRCCNAIGLGQMVIPLGIPRCKIVSRAFSAGIVTILANQLIIKKLVPQNNKDECNRFDGKGNCPKSLVKVIGGKHGGKQLSRATSSLRSFDFT